MKFLELLHVLAAILIVGPLAVAPFSGLRGIRRRDADAVKQAATWELWFGVASIATFLLGVATTAASKDWLFSTPWIIISMTLYLVALVLVFAWTLPAMRRAGRMIEEGVIGVPARIAGDADDPKVTASGSELQSKAQLDAIRGRVTASGGVVLLLLVVITVFMVLRPFGK